jgi:hypothetical protein
MRGVKQPQKESNKISGRAKKDMKKPSSHRKNRPKPWEEMKIIIKINEQTWEELNNHKRS